MRVMPRKNRTTVKSHRRNQRSKVLRLLDGEQVYRRVMDARPETGSTTTRIALIAVVVGLLVGLGTGVADAKVAYVDGISGDVGNQERVTYHAHVSDTNWTYIELAQGSEWMATPCKEEDSRNCWWNACRRGNGSGTSFFNLQGHVHPVRRACPARPAQTKASR